MRPLAKLLVNVKGRGIEGWVLKPSGAMGPGELSGASAVENGEVLIDIVIGRAAPASRN